MMRNINIGIIFLAITTMSCQKELVSENKSNTIQLQIYAPDVSVTKSEIATIADLSQITLFATHNDADMFNVLNPKPEVSKIPQIGVTVKKPTDKTLWPLNFSYKGVPSLETKDGAGTKTWGDKANDTYQFHAFASNPTYPNSSITVRQEGTEVTITQPEKLKITNPGKLETIDYLLSYKVKYGTDDQANVNKPVVPIHLEHALTKVTVRANIKSNIDRLVIEFSGLKSKCKLKCKQKTLGVDDLAKNDWTCTYLGNTTAVYTYEQSNKTLGDKPQELMSFTAFPADHSTLENYKLRIQSTMNGKTYEKTYTLSNTKDWLSGHHVIYYITIDDQIHLTGSIEKWQEVDFIEGTILPTPKPQV